MSKFMIETRELGGWADAQWTEDDKPLRFDTVQEGETAIQELIADVKQAVARGDMTDEVDPTTLRVVPAPEDMLCDQCGHSMTIKGEGIAHHLDLEGEIDYEQDADHVAYTTP